MYIFSNNVTYHYSTTTSISRRGEGVSGGWGVKVLCLDWKVQSSRPTRYGISWKNPREFYFKALTIQSCAISLSINLHQPKSRNKADLQKPKCCKLLLEWEYALPVNSQNWFLRNRLKWFLQEQPHSVACSWHQSCSLRWQASYKIPVRDKGGGGNTG